MKRIVIFISSLVLIILAAWTLHGLAAPLRADPPPEDAQDVETAIRAAIRAERDEAAALSLFETEVAEVRLSDDALWATALLLPLDPNSGDTLPCEPGLALSRWDGSAWQVILPSNPLWLEMLLQTPDSLLNAEIKAAYEEQYRQAQVDLPTSPLTGYLLPWPFGETRALSQGVVHDKYTTSGKAHFAFDYYLSGQMWNLYASKGGEVWLIKEDVDTCLDHSCSETQGIGNYIVLKDTTTTPVSYQLYLHIAKDSVPSNLNVGDKVERGQLIGVVDNTGQSWGHHLHYMVHTNPYSYWGQSVDILYGDVTINGGRPRSPADPPYCKSSDVCQTFRTNYVSGNHIISATVTDEVDPTGVLTGLSNGQIILTDTLTLSGLATDEGSGLDSAQFVANYDNTWHDIGPRLTNSAATPAYTWDWCAAGIPDGVVSVALRLQDKAGNLSPYTSVIHVVKQYACPAACQPGDGEVALFSQAEFGGACQNFAIGSFSALGGVGDNQAASLLVGKNVQATVYLNSDFSGRGETFFASDNLLSDNRIGAGTISALKVISATVIPQPPLALTGGVELTQGDVATLVWENTVGGVEFQARVSGAAELTSTWQSAIVWRLADLPAGSYGWQARARSPAGESAWSAAQPFRVVAAAETLPDPLLPFTDDMETSPANWSASGLWRRVNDESMSRSGASSWWFQTITGTYALDQQPVSGDLTSVPISITAGSYFLRFYYLYAAESHAPHWDQRWLQIAVDDGPFQNALQLSDDPDLSEITSGNWLKAPPVDLSPYQGHAIRLRFHFDSLDGNFNNFKGWGIDDVSISSSAPPQCSDADNTPAQAIPLTYAQTVNGEICPNGDVDFYRFTGKAGDPIGADIEAKTIGSQLDSYLSLIGPDGVSVLAENDDKLLEKLTDSRVSFILPADGVYYLKVRAWNHPTAGGVNYNYVLHLVKDSRAPQISITFPTDGSYLPAAVISVTAIATDAVGISCVEFYWHNGDWSAISKWQRIGVDDSSADSADQNTWAINFNAQQANQSGAAIYAKAYDRAGHWTISGAWMLAIDTAPPMSLLAGLPAAQSSTAINLLWFGLDDVSNIAHYDLQWNINNAGWTNYPTTFAGNVAETWVIGEAGKQYAFRLRAVDTAGNQEAYPAEAEAVTSIPAANALCASPDAWENDNTLQAAHPLTETVQTHTFCNPAGALNDVDWVSLAATGGKGYILEARPLEASAAAVVISIYAADGVTLLAEAAPAQLNQPTYLTWNAKSTGKVYLRLKHLDGRVAGKSVAYTISLAEGLHVFLPLVIK